MTDLACAIRAAIDETEQDADDFHQVDCERVAQRDFPLPCTCGEPQRRRRRCAADRKILDLHRPTRPPRNLTAPAAWCGRCSQDPPYEHMSESWPCQTVKALAVAYGVGDTAPDIPLDKTGPEIA